MKRNSVLAALCAFIGLVLKPVDGTAEVWPTNGWESRAPAEMGLDVAKLREARDYALTGGGSGMIARGGYLVYSWGSQDTIYDLKSSTKSIGGSALGLAVGDNFLQLTDFAQQHLPSLGLPPDSNAATGWLDDITVAALATHTAGFDRDGGYEALVFEPGTTWSYSDAGVNWLADMLTVTFGQDLRSLLFARVFSHLGITSADLTWRLNSYRDRTINGITRRELGSGISANVDAMGRIGYLYLRDGNWNGLPILPPGYATQVRSPLREVVGLPVHLEENYPNASDHYGVLWWTNADGTLPDVPRDAYWSWGLYDSWIIVIPSLDIVAARAGGPVRTLPGLNYGNIAPFITPIVAAVTDSSTVSVPNVVGLTQVAATAAITGAGLVVGTVTPQSSATVPAGSVISQSPASGTNVSAGSAVNLVVSSGPASSGLTADFLRFDGEDDIVTSGDIDLPSQATIEAWIRPTTVSNEKLQDRIVSKDVNLELMVSTADTGCSFGSNGHVQWRLTIGGVNLRLCGGVLRLNTWQHVAGTYDGSVLRLYINGLLVASAERSGALTTNNVALTIGNHPAWVRPFDGDIDEVRIWNRARTTAEIQAAMNVELSGPMSGLVAYYRLNDGSGQTVTDSSGNARNAVLGTTGSVESRDPAWGSSGAVPVVVPDVVGLTQSAATATITGAGLVLGTVTSQASATVPVGSVISQSPAAGASVSAGAAVNLVVSSGPASVLVPDVVGLTQSAATAAITGAGLVVGTVTPQSSATVPVGSVISQSPAAGASVSAGAAVNLVASSGPASPGVTADFLRFDGTNDVVTSGDIDLPSQVTVEAWIRPTTVSNVKLQDRIVSKDINLELMVSTGDTGCSFGSNGHVQWRLTIAGSNLRLCGGVLELNTWQHVAGTYDGSALRLFINGTMVASAARSGALTTNNVALAIGNHPAWGRPFDGDIDEVRIWNRARTTAEIEAAMNVELSGPMSGLVAYYRLNDGSGQTVTDSSGNARNAMLGTTTSVEIQDPLWVTD